MLTLVFFKLLSDLGLYYSFAGFFAAMAGAGAPFMFTIFILQAVIGLLTYLLREKGVLRFLPLALLAVCFALPGCGYVEWIVAAPPALYVVYIAAKRLYHPEWYEQVSIFHVYWIVLLIFCAFALLMDCGEEVAAVTAPAGMISLTCCVILMRSLRHDASVYCAPRFQVMNLATAGGVMLGAAAVSSGAFLETAMSVLRWIYQTVCYPLLFLLLWILSGIVRVITWLFSWIKLEGQEQQQEEQVELNTSGMQEILGGAEGGQNSEMFMRVATALVVILAAVVVFFVFRWLSRRAHRDEGKMISGERSAVERKPSGRRFSIALTPVEQVRAQYRKYLKLCRAKGFTFEKSDTSKDIETRTQTAMEPVDLQSMRQIYIAARYNNEATKEDAEEAKRLYKSLAEPSQKQND